MSAARANWRQDVPVVLEVLGALFYFAFWVLFFIAAVHMNPYGMALAFGSAWFFRNSPGARS